MAGRLFDPEGTIWKPLGYLGDFVMLSLMWAVCCIPVVTVGPATTALYDSAVHALRRGDDALLSRFIQTFKRELGSGILATVIWILIFLAAWGVYQFLVRSLPEGESRPVILIFYLVLVGFFLLCILAWVFPTLSRFTFSAAALEVTAVKLAFGYILRSAGLAVMIGAVLYLSFRFGIPIMVLPGAAAYASTFLIEPVFKKYEALQEG